MKERKKEKDRRRDPRNSKFVNHHSLFVKSFELEGRSVCDVLKLLMLKK